MNPRYRHTEPLTLGFLTLGAQAAPLDARFSPFFGTFIAAVMVQQTPRGDEVFFTMLEGAANHILDVGALSLLPAWKKFIFERKC